MHLTDYHTHTIYSHGKGTVLENAQAAKEKGFKEIAITDHGFNHMCYGVLRKCLPDLYADIIEAERETGLKVYLGIEANIISFDGDVDITPKDFEYVEFLVVGFHLFASTKIPSFFNFILGNIFSTKVNKWSKERIEKNTQAYVKAVHKYPIDIISHLGYYCKVNCYEVAKACAETNTYIELNGKRIHFSQQDIDDMLKTDVKFVIDSDAHSPSRVGDFEMCQKMIDMYNIPIERIANYNDVIIPKDKKGFKL